jgi:hypothetical protein
MFRRLESINEGLQPKIYGNTYLTVQTESHKLPEIPNNIPPKSFSKYSYYKTHKETPEYIVANMIAKEADISVYKSILPHGRYSQPSVDFSKLQGLTLKHYLPSTFVEGSLGSVVSRTEHIPTKEPLKIRKPIPEDLRKLEEYSFCNDIRDDAINVPIKCIQEEFKRLGVPFNQRIKENVSMFSWKKIKGFAAALSIEQTHKTKKKKQYYSGIEILWFNKSTNIYVDRITAFTENKFNIEDSDELSQYEFYMVANIVPPKETSCSIRLSKQNSMIYVTDIDKIPTLYDPFLCWKLKKGLNRIFGVWQSTGKVGECNIEISPCNKVYNKIDPKWLVLTQEPRAPLFSFEGHNKTFHEVRFPNIMVLVLSPKLKIVETNSIFPLLLQLRRGSESGVATLQRSIMMNSWRTITCAFVAAPGKGVLFSFGPLMVNIVGTNIEFKWSSASLDVKYVFRGLINADSSTPYLAVVGMRSDLDGIYPNRISFYIASFEDWSSGRITTEKFDSQGVTFTTKNFETIYNTTDSAILTIGHDTVACNVAVAWIRVFDYEMESDDVVRDVRSTWN